MEKKKILYICSEAAPGMIPYACGIILSASASHELDIYAITVDDKYLSYHPYLNNFPPGKISFLSVPDNTLKKIFNKIYAYNILREARKMIKDNNIDAVHLLTGDYTCSLIIPKLKKLCKVFFTVHDLIPHEYATNSAKAWLFKHYLLQGIKRNIKYSDNLITNSKIQYNQMKELYPQKNIFFHTFPSLISDSVLNGKDICPEIRDIDNYILFFGNIDKYKGIEYLYDAFNKNSNLNSYNLVIAGNGNIYFQHSDDHRIIFINRYIKDEEVNMLFKRAACVVYPYISATQSGVLSLAYKLQTPALISDVPFFIESSGDECCLYFKRTDADDLSDKLETLLLKTDLVKMKKAQEKYYESRYSQKAGISQIEAIYTSVQQNV